MSNLWRVNSRTLNSGEEGEYARENACFCWRLCASAGCREVLSLAQSLNSVLVDPQSTKLS